MRLHVEDGKYFIRGFYNHGEEHFISGYLLAYGDRLLSVSPPALKELLLLRLDSMRTHILGL
jgi:predicted DNA-binding transcriptional regulator YafY